MIIDQNEKVCVCMCVYDIYDIYDRKRRIQD